MNNTRLKIAFLSAFFVVGGGFIALAFLVPKTAPWIAAGYLINYATELYKKTFKK